MLQDSRRRIAASRMILPLPLTLSLVMPVNEHVWHGNELLRGGQDVKLCLLGALALCGLVALTVEQVVASPLLLMLLWHWQRLFSAEHVQTLPVHKPAEVRCRPQRTTRPIDLTVPVSLLCLRI